MIPYCLNFHEKCDGLGRVPGFIRTCISILENMKTVSQMLFKQIVTF
jgi:hypothetical protein